MVRASPAVRIEMMERCYRFGTRLLAYSNLRAWTEGVVGRHGVQQVREEAVAGHPPGDVEGGLPADHRERRAEDQPEHGAQREEEVDTVRRRHRREQVQDLQAVHAPGGDILPEVRVPQGHVLHVRRQGDGHHVLQHGRRERGGSGGETIRRGSLGCEGRRRRRRPHGHQRPKGFRGGRGNGEWRREGGARGAGTAGLAGQRGGAAAES